MFCYVPPLEAAWGSAGPLVPCCWLILSGQLCSLWRFNHVFWPLPTLVISCIPLMPGTPSSSFTLGPSQYYYPQLSPVLFSCSPYPSPLWFLISLYLVYLLIYSFIYSVDVYWVTTISRHLAQSDERADMFLLLWSSESSREKKHEVHNDTQWGCYIMCFAHMNTHLLNSV